MNNRNLQVREGSLFTGEKEGQVRNNMAIRENEHIRKEMNNKKQQRVLINHKQRRKKEREKDSKKNSLFF
jgi:hypothetical protein